MLIRRSIGEKPFGGFAVCPILRAVALNWEFGMSRYSPKPNGIRCTARKGSNLGTLAAGAAAVVVVVGFLVYCVRTPSGTTPSDANVAASGRRDTDEPGKRPACRWSFDGGPVDHGQTCKDRCCEKHRCSRVIAAERRQPNLSRPIPRLPGARLVRDQLRRANLRPPWRRQGLPRTPPSALQLLKSVADAQAAIGDYEAADRSISRMSIPESREQAHAQNSAPARRPAVRPTQLS